MKKLFRIKSLALIAFVAILSISCNDDDPAPVAVDNSITGKAVATPNLSILVQALTKAELAGTLQGTGPFTVFAPTNAAFEKYLADNNIGSIDAIPKDKLTQILLNHVVRDKVLSTDLKTGYIETLATFENTNSVSIYVNTDTASGTKLLNGVANVEKADISASNGIIHIIDAVIDNPKDETITAKAIATPSLSILVQALTKADLAGALQGTGPFTVFAPTNAAFEKYLADNKIASLEAIPDDKLKQILLNHVVSGKVTSGQLTTGYIKTLASFGTSTSNISMYINTATTPGTKLLNGVANVLTNDVEASNGVVHIVDAVIDVPTIVTHAVANSSFSTLASVLTAQGLIPTLSGTASSPLTVFAPLNSAFDDATLSLYTGLTSDQKSAVLKYHVVNANVLSTAIPTSPISTLQGQTINIAGTVITDAEGRKTNIVLTNVQCGNGVIHAIDKVLLPKL